MGLDVAVTAEPMAVPAAEFSAMLRVTPPASVIAVPELDHAPFALVVDGPDLHLVALALAVRPVMVVLVPVPVKEWEVQLLSPESRYWTS